MRTAIFTLWLCSFAALALCTGCESDAHRDPRLRTRESVVVESARATDIVLAVRALVGRGGPARFVSDGGRVRVELPGDSGRSRLRSVSVTLPADAAGSVELTDPSGVAVRFALSDAVRAPIAAADGFAVYPGALPGADVLYRIDARGAEDFLAFAQQPSVEAIDYSMDVTRVAGLRQIGQVLELLDADGTPRLRVQPPSVIDRAGSSHRARLAVRGCAVDRNPVAPWGRPVTRPGVAACSLHLDWSGLGVTYPAVVDPHWVATADMTAPRATHTATLMKNGKVLVAGGGNDESSAELYDEGTNTFAATSSMTTPRTGHTAVLLKDGTVLLASGGAGPLGFILSSEVYDPATGVFTPSGDENEMHGGAPFVMLDDGRVLVASGHNHFGTTDAAELYDPATGQFSYTGTMLQGRSNYSATLLSDGTVLFAGGAIPINPGELDSAELYDPATGQFAATGSLSGPRSDHTGTLLQSGKVLIAGGADAPNLTTELYDPTIKTFALGPDLASGQSSHEALRLSDGTVLIAGGADAANFTKTAQLYDPVQGTVTKLDPMLSPRADFTLTLLASGNPLAVGGFDAGGAVIGLFSAERLVPGNAKANGEICTAASECTSGFCADGVCCESACDKQCESCGEAGKAGSCQAVKGAPRPPRAACIGAGPCGGQCDGTHRDACAYPTSSLNCGTSCGSGMLTSSFCDGKGSCAAGAPTVCPDNLSCADLQSCATQCSSPADCTSDHVCVAKQCVSVCDGDHTVTQPNGSKADCSPYTCSTSGCKLACSTNTDCVAPASCTAGKCVAPTKKAETSDESSGCALVSGRTRSDDLWFAALGLSLFAWKRRRRWS